MKQLIFILAVTLFVTGTAQSQNYITKNGKISFFSKTDIEDIDAVNNQVMSVLNIGNGDLAFSVLIKNRATICRKLREPKLWKLSTNQRKD